MRNSNDYVEEDFAKKVMKFSIVEKVSCPSKKNLDAFMAKIGGGDIGFHSETMRAIYVALSRETTDL